MAERQLINSVDGGGISDVEVGEAPVCPEIERIGSQRRLVPRRGGIHRVAIIDAFGPGVNSAQRKPAAEAVIDVDL